MRGVDEETGEYLSPSRSEERREALAVLELAGKLIEQNDTRIQQLPMSAELIALTITSKKITSQIARKRQMQFLAKQLRREDEEVLVAIRAAVAKLVAEGKTLEQIQAAKPTAAWDAEWGQKFIKPDVLINAVYADVRSK